MDRESNQNQVEGILQIKLLQIEEIKN